MVVCVFIIVTLSTYSMWDATTRVTGTIQDELLLLILAISFAEILYIMKMMNHKIRQRYD